MLINLIKLNLYKLVTPKQLVLQVLYCPSLGELVKVLLHLVNFCPLHVLHMHQYFEMK